MNGLLISERINNHAVHTFSVPDAVDIWAVVVVKMPGVAVLQVKSPPTRYELELWVERIAGMWAAVEHRN